MRRQRARRCQQSSIRAGRAGVKRGVSRSCTRGQNTATVACADQFIEQDPGPRGSPQVPQAPIFGSGYFIGELCPTRVAKADSFRSSVVAWQAGHSGV